MTLFELGLSNGSISLATLLDGDETSTLADEIPIPELVELTCIGGWPALVGSSVAEAQGVLAGYLDSIARTDIRRLDGVARDPRKVRATVRSLARNVASQASISTAARNAGGPDGPVDDDTVRSYLAALERLMVVEDQPAWMPRLRSRSRRRTAPERHFCDPSLAAAALGASPARLLRDLESFGLPFESLVLRDLRVYAQYLGAEVLHYRDNLGDGRRCRRRAPLGCGRGEARVGCCRRGGREPPALRSTDRHRPRRRARLPRGRPADSLRLHPRRRGPGRSHPGTRAVNGSRAQALRQARAARIGRNPARRTAVTSGPGCQTKAIHGEVPGIRRAPSRSASRAMRAEAGPSRAAP